MEYGLSATISHFPQTSDGCTNFITLLTDFGLTDTYVGVMKGVVASINPAARIIDLSHNIKPQDIREAAFLLAGSFSYFPPGTIHVVVVDPTVGSERPALCVQSGGYFFIGPDNGVTSIACYRAGRPKIFGIENEDYFLKDPSHTFHGRDIFAPAAAHLSAGIPIELMGQRMRSMKRIRQPRPKIEITKRPVQSKVRGQVVHIDKFGNLITNITEKDIQEAFSGAAKEKLLVLCGEHKIKGLSSTYSNVSLGEPLALFGSYALLEVSVREGDASNILSIKRGDPVTILSQAS